MKIWKQFGAGAIAAISIGSQGAWATVAEVQDVDASAALTVSEEAVAPAEVLQPATYRLSEAITVNELSDVLPSDWAYGALQRLVEQYGCVAGYPDGTFRGDRTMTRYEFAALLETCLSEVTALMAEGIISEADMATIQRLQTSFSQELTTLATRLEELEADAAALAANSFSTTTRLRSEVIFSLEQLAGNEQANGSGDDLPDAMTFGSRARLNFNTSFTGQDLLKIRLDALNPTRLNAPVTGTNMTRLTFDRDTNNSFDIGKLFYRFPVSDRLGLHIDATRGAYQANVSSTFNPGFANPISGAVSRFGRFNPIYYQGALGTGITGVYDLSSDLTLSAGYIARGDDTANSEVGLFGGGYTALAQLDFRPTDTVKLGAVYARSYYPSGEVAVAAGTGSRLANAPFGNNIATSANHFGLQSSVKLGADAILSGWAGLSLASAESDRGAVSDGDDATSLNWAVTLGLPHLGGKGHFGGVLVGQPPRVLSNDGGPDEEDATWHLEAFYRYRISPNISLIPGFVVLVNPENNSDNDTIWLGSLRTVFQF
ncbi:s-layer protein [Leptolyngbya sp. Heron Island J]|uniref:iron uptake porin n=1 Tax=Leptolyngbya sp. Heron Island J TaxID=1385935 RepID=UPI0003B98A00|nr:iron uptake porin [Leptolyngbya sp. Heron Island J]ESA34041.1 s-layer protein [Leptolyngbya sp. Heron Island J]